MNITQIFNAMKFDADKCGNCIFLSETKDASGTGDSKSIFECRLLQANACLCWLARREFDNIKEQETT